MDIHRGSGPLRSGPTGPGSGFSVMPILYYSSISCFGSNLISKRLAKANKRNSVNWLIKKKNTAANVASKPVGQTLALCKRNVVLREVMYL